MSLLKKTEDQTETTGQADAVKHEPVQEAPQETAQAETKAPAEVTARALANHQAQQTALAARAPKANIHHVKQMKDALRVDFNTLAQIQATQGKFKDKETGKVLGETLEFQLLSFQDSFVCSPNDLKAPKELVKYSDDGKVAKDDGADLFAHLKMLKEDGWSKAKIQDRCVIVGALLAAEKDQSLVEQLVQLDLAPQSRSLFMRYIANATYNLQVGKLTEEQSTVLVLTAEPAVGPDNTDYTRVAVQIKALTRA